MSCKLFTATADGIEVFYPILLQKVIDCDITELTRMNFQRVGLKHEEPVRHRTLLRRWSMTPGELEDELFWGGWYGISAIHYQS
jgi:hypothetical protein